MVNNQHAQDGKADTGEEEERKWMSIDKQNKNKNKGWIEKQNKTILYTKIDLKFAELEKLKSQNWSQSAQKSKK